MCPLWVKQSAGALYGLNGNDAFSSQNQLVKVWCYVNMVMIREAITADYCQPSQLPQKCIYSCGMIMIFTRCSLFVILPLMRWFYTIQIPQKCMWVGYPL